MTKGRDKNIKKGSVRSCPKYISTKVRYSHLVNCNRSLIFWNFCFMFGYISMNILYFQLVCWNSYSIMLCSDWLVSRDNWIAFVSVSTFRSPYWLLPLHYWIDYRLDIIWPTCVLVFRETFQSVSRYSSVKTNPLLLWFNVFIRTNSSLF